MAEQGFELVAPTEGGVRHLQIVPLRSAGVRHGFSCRGPAGPGSRDGDVAALARALGLEGLPRARLRQIHSARVWPAEQALGGVPREGDALVAARPGVALTLFTADCLPLLLVDPAGGSLAAVHAGWRGTLEEVLPGAIAALADAAGCRPSQLLVAAGPAIRACCYEVGPEVEAAFAARHAGWEAWMRPGPRRRHLDLLAANREQAARAGVPPERFLDPAPCTRCRSDLFYSYRADGPGTGRIVTLAALLPP